MVSPLKLTEKAFQHQVEHLAHVFGWRLYHALPAMNHAGRWRTAQSGDIGFPDLVLAHPIKGLICAELKTQTGRVTESQRTWLNYLEAAGAECYVWRPSDFDAIKTRLQGAQK